VIGISLWDAVPQFRGTRFQEQYRLAMQTQQPVHFSEFAEPFGACFDVHAYPSPEGLSIYFRDITEQKLVQKSLGIERHRLRAVLDALPVGVFISDETGRLLEANRAAQEIWEGATPLAERPEDYGAYRGWWSASGEPLAADDWALARAILHGEIVDGEEVEIESFDGTRKTVLTYALPIRNGGGEVFGGVAVVVDVTERTRLLQEARAARMAAEGANRAKSEFLATMSHEIRTPINAIIGYTELLEMGIAGPITEAQRTQLERVRSSSAHLLGLINDVLDLAKVEAGRMKVGRDRAVVQHVVSTAMALVTPQAAERDLRLDTRCSGTQQIVYCGDEDRVRQILVNILSNAVKFTESGGSITIECGRTDRPDPDVQVSGSGPWVFVSVSDSGIGIAADELEQVFHPFVQADSGHTRERGGTGLGLTISRELARLMEGDVTARSEPGAGSEFTLWLPEPRATEAKGREIDSGVVPDGGVLVCVGRAVLKEVDQIMTAFTERLREDATFGDSGGLGDADLRDHGVAFLTDIAQSLVAVEQSTVDPIELLRDGGEIQRVISELHGAQRARLGWGPAQVKREFDILREEVERSVRRQTPQVPEADLRKGIDVLIRCLDLAERISERALGEDHP
jgi:signal transduction histidine kinase